MPAKSPKRRKFRAYIKGRISQFLSLTTLGGVTLVSDIIDDTVDETTYISSVKATWALKGLSLDQNDGPIMVGWAHSDYTDAEIQANITQNTNWSRGDLVSQEIGKRKVKIVGVLTAAPSVAEGSTLNDGKPITTKLGWVLTTGQSIRYWAFNMGSSALDTTVPKLFVEGHANLWPR